MRERILLTIATAALALGVIACGEPDPSGEWTSIEARLQATIEGDVSAWAIPADGLQCEIHTHTDGRYTVQVGVFGPDDILEFAGPGFGIATLTMGDAFTERRAPFLDNGSDRSDDSGSVSHLPVAPGTGTRGWWYLSDPVSGRTVALDERPTSCTVRLEVFTTDDPVVWDDGS